MFRFFGQVIDFFGVLLDFIVQLVRGMITLMVMIPRSITFLSQSVAFVPPVFMGFMFASVFVSVIFLIVGRTGKS